MRYLQKIGPIDRYIASRIKKFRLERGVGIEQLGELSGVSFQQIQKYEKAVNKIGAVRLFQIAHALDMPISAFFDGLQINGKYYNISIKSEGARKQANDELNDDLLPLIRSFNLIENKQIKRQIVNLVKEIAGPHSRKKIKHQYS